MAVNTTPVVTDSPPVTVVTAQVVARGSTVRATIDLRTSIGAWFFPRIGRGGTTAITGGTTVGAKWLFRRVLNNGTALAGGMMGPVLQLLSSNAAAASTTCATSDSTSGSATLNVASITGFSAEDNICIQDSGGGVTRLEYNRVSKTATGILTLDAPLYYTHTAAGADTVRNLADIYAPVWIDGGSLIEVIFDYGDATGGDSMTVACYAQQLTSYITQ